MTIQIASNKTIYLDGQPTRLALAQRQDRTVIYSPGGAGIDYTEHAMPHARYSAVHDAPASGVAGRAQLEADLRELLAAKPGVVINGQVVDLAAARALMDDDLCNAIHGTVETEQDFVDAYLAAHRAKYGADFVVA